MRGWWRSGWVCMGILQVLEGTVWGLVVTVDSGRADA